MLCRARRKALTSRSVAKTSFATVDATMDVNPNYNNIYDLNNLSSKNNVCYLSHIPVRGQFDRQTSTRKTRDVRRGVRRFCFVLPITSFHSINSAIRKEARQTCRPDWSAILVLWTCKIMGSDEFVSIFLHFRRRIKSPSLSYFEASVSWSSAGWTFFSAKFWCCVSN